jgi:hypothetical protein
MNRNHLEKSKWEMYDVSAANMEHDLFDSSIVEYNDIFGIKINYYVRDESIEMDNLYGESTNTGYLDVQSTKMVYETGDEATITDPFGITAIDLIQYGWLPKSTYTRDVSRTYSPKPGDVIQTPWNERSYEVVDVAEEGTIFQLGKFVWEFVIKPYRFSDQSDSAEDISYDADNTLTQPLTAFGENAWIDEESDEIDNYSDIDSSIYGF